MWQRSAIEKCKTFEHRGIKKAYPHLFSLGYDSDLDAQNPAGGENTRLYELVRYSKALFKCEARFYKTNAPNEETLRSWLALVAKNVAKEVIAETQACFDNWRCTVAERKREVAEGLRDEAEYWIALYREQAGSSSRTSVVPDRAAAIPDKDSSAETGAGWASIEIKFLSDERLQIFKEGSSETRNYAELGFEDRRNGMPNQAWLTLRTLAMKRGTIHDSGGNTLVEGREADAGITQGASEALRNHGGSSPFQRWNRVPGVLQDQL